MRVIISDLSMNSIGLVLFIVNQNLSIAPIRIVSVHKYKKLNNDEFVRYVAMDHDGNEIVVNDIDRPLFDSLVDVKDMILSTINKKIDATINRAELRAAALVKRIDDAFGCPVIQQEQCVNADAKESYSNGQ